MTANNVNNLKDSDFTTPASTSTGSAPAPHDGSYPLMSFVDMLFGGRLTSILVCQKCKHVSQTYEDFNDISLSIKAEDYFFGRGSNIHGKKRDKLKKLAKRLTTFPGSGGGGWNATQGSHLNTSSTTTMPGFQALCMEMQRSSSVPPSPSRPRAGDGNAHLDGEDDGHSSLVEPPRRKSLDWAESGVVGTMSRVSVDVETPPSSGVETENESEGVGRTAVELEVPPPMVFSEEVESSELEPAFAASENREKEDKVKEDDIIVESDSSHVLVHVAPGERHVELVEPAMKTRERDGKDRDKKEDAAWAKLGRRISIMTGGLGRSKDREKAEKLKSKEKDRKSWSTDRTGMGLAVKEKPEAAGSSDSTSLVSSHVAAVPGPIAVTASSSSSGSTTAHNFFKTLPRASSTLSTSTLNTSIAPVSTSQPQSSQNQNQHLAAPSNEHHNTSSPLFTGVQRSRSPKLPKPTAAESEYLRKILADMASSSSGLHGPFSLFKPPALLSGTHPFSTSASSGLTGSSGGGAGMWLGLNQLSGIEECLRLFTAVEVLDGENMVGCRRCWKIANGVLDVKGSNRQEEEDSDEEQEQEQEGRSDGVTNQDEVVHGLKKLHPRLEALSVVNVNTPIHIPTSISTPTVTFYTLSNSSGSRSISSLPTEATSVSNSNEDPSLAEFEESGNPPIGPGPGGMTIPIISTTSPLDTPMDDRTSFARAQRLAVSSMIEPSVTNGAGNKNRTINGVLSGQDSSINPSSSYITPLSSVPTPTLAKYSASGSKDSLLIPKMPMYRRRKIYDSSTSASASGTDIESSDDEESDTSVGTSVSEASCASASAKDSTPSNVHISSSVPSQGQQQAQAGAQQTSTSTSTAQQTKPKEKKPKPVIMRAAYKRYLIAVPPPVLVIHLKRFQQTSKMPLISFSHGLKKLDDNISFPEYLDLMPFLAPKKEDYGLGKKKKKGVVKAKEEKCMYRLYAVVVHIGNMVSSSFAYNERNVWLMLFSFSWVDII